MASCAVRWWRPSLGIGSGPIGVLLMLRRMSLAGDALSHAVLLGAAIGFLVAGSLSLPAMGLGGLIAGLSVALLSGLVSRTTVTFDPEHLWFYVPEMNVDEVLLLKCYDSETDGRARFAPHTAFADPTTPPGAPPRESARVPQRLIPP